MLLATGGIHFQAVHASTFLRFESTYRGDGWFQYRMTILPDPFFATVWVRDLNFPCTNQIDQFCLSTNWANTNDPTYGYTTWTRDSLDAARPYEVTFLNRSAETTYRRYYQTNGGACYFIIGGTASALIGSESFLGYVSAPCLAPCAPDQADGSPTNFVYDLTVIPDIRINQLIQTNTDIYGVEFGWTDPSTVLLQGSTDLIVWTNITYIWGDRGNTVWTTNQPLNQFGSFFRLQLISNSHLDNPPPLQSSLTRKSATPTTFIPSLPNVTSCKPMGDKLRVTIAGIAGRTYVVQATDVHRNVLCNKRVKMAGSNASVDFDARELPMPVFFQIVPASHKSKR